MIHPRSQRQSHDSNPGQPGSKAYAFDHSVLLLLESMECLPCVLGRGQGRHGSKVGVQLRLFRVWEEAGGWWGRASWVPKTQS